MTVIIVGRADDRPVRRLSPDAEVVLDASNCILIRTPERRITVSNVAEWCEALELARTFQRVYDDDAESRRLAELAEHRRKRP